MLACVMRSDVARWLAVLLIAPMLVFGVFNRATFLAHGHGAHGMHLHPVGVLDDGKLAAADHAHDHSHGHAALRSDSRDGGELVCCELGNVPCGDIICFHVHKQLPTRGLDLGRTLSPAAIVAAVLPLSPNLDPHVGVPRGTLNGGPMNLLALSAGDRLVRTSRALLI